MDLMELQKSKVVVSAEIDSFLRDKVQRAGISDQVIIEYAYKEVVSLINKNETGKVEKPVVQLAKPVRGQYHYVSRNSPKEKELHNRMQQFLFDHGASTKREIAKYFKMPLSSTYAHLMRLKEKGMVESMGGVRHRRYYAPMVLTA